MNESSPSPAILLMEGGGKETAADDYEYDVSESLDHYNWAELIPVVIVYSVVLLLGVLGNALIIFTISRYRRLKTITNIFLASLASADLLLVTICVPVNLAKLFSYTWTFGVFLCKFVHYMQNVSAICSVLTFTAMSIERYYAIVHPMRAQYLCTVSQARKVIVGIWIASFILALPTLWIQIHLPVGERVPAYWCVRDWESPVLWQIYELYMLVLVLVIPLTIMAFAYGAIVREIWRVTYLRSVMANDSAPEEIAPTASNAVLTASLLKMNKTTATAPIAQHSRDGIDGQYSPGTPSRLPDVISNPAEACRSFRRNGTLKVNFKRSSSSSQPDNNRTQSPGTELAATRRSILSNRTANNRSSENVLQTNKASPTTSASSQRLQNDYRTARQVVKMLVAVVVLFTVCWSPYLIDNVLMSFELLPGARTGPVKHMRIAFHLLSYINSCCNPFVYGFMSRNFRRGFEAALKWRAGRCCNNNKRSDDNFHRARQPRHHSHRLLRSARQRSVYKFSEQDSRASRVITQIRIQDPGCARSGLMAAVETVPANSLEDSKALFVASYVVNDPATPSAAGSSILLKRSKSAVPKTVFSVVEWRTTVSDGALEAPQISAASSSADEFIGPNINPLSSKNNKLPFLEDPSAQQLFEAMKTMKETAV